MTKLRAAVLTGLLALTGACGNTKGGGGTGGTGGGGGSDGGTDTLAEINVSVSGIASPHPLTLMLDPTASFTMVTVSIVDPAVELAGGPALASAPLDTTACVAPSDGGAADGGDAAAGGGAAGCPWIFPSVNIAGITLGLVGKIEDQRTTNPIWVKTGTGAGTGTFIGMEKTSKAPITGRQLFAVSKMTQAGLAVLVSGVL